MSQRGFTPIIVILIIVILGSLAFFFSKNEFRLNPQEIENKETNNFRYKIAYRVGGDYNHGGDLWIMNPDGTDQKKITSVGDIDAIYAWSPDNQFILVSQAYNNDLSLIEISTGKLKVLKKLDCYGDSYRWISNAEILAIKPACRNDTLSKIEKISINGESKILLTFPDDISEIDKYFSLGSSSLAFSPDLNLLAFDKKQCCEQPIFDPKLYIYNMKEKSKKLLKEGVTFLGWHQNKILFLQQANEVWEINPDGTDSQKVFEDNNPIKDAPTLGSISTVISSKDGNFLLYGRNVGWVEYYLFDLKSNTSKMLFKQLFNDWPHHISISPDSSFVVYIQRFGHDEIKDPEVCFTRFIKGDESVKVTNEKCFYPTISN